MRTDEQKAELLDKAADLLDRKGWCRGTVFQARTGEMCMIGAVGAAEAGTDRGQYPSSFRFEDELATLLNLDYPSCFPTRTVSHVNDTVITSKREAVTALRRMARRLRGQRVRPLKRNQGVSA